MRKTKHAGDQQRQSTACGFAVKMLLLCSLVIATTGSALSAAEAWTGGSVSIENEKNLALMQGDYDDPEVSAKDMKFYVGSLDAWMELPAYFINGVTDVPYVELSDWGDVMVTLYQEYGGDTGYELSIEKDGPVAQYERENGFHMLFDFKEDSISFDDFDLFLHDSSDSSLLDFVSAGVMNDDGEADLFKRVERGSYDRYGSQITLNLADYGIRMFCNDEGYFVPLQTMCDFLLSNSLQLNSFFNGEAVILADLDQIGNAYDGYTDLGEFYYSADGDTRSEDLAHFSYCELCLVLDSLYGQKEIHEISSFDQFFTDTGYKEYLLSTEPVDADVALEYFINYYLDDLHSAFNGYSYLCGTAETEENLGLANTRFDELYNKYCDTREELMGEEIPPYQEVGDTAFITFDTFYNDEASVYYDNPGEQDINMDTIALIIYSHSQITRKDSPIQNVVIDLSCNTGGTVDAAAFLLAWCLGKADLTLKDTLTGAVSTSVYEADINLDHKFDEDDNIADKNLYCLISPASFSCGNLVPNAFKSSHRVTLLGRTSGGGSCLVMPLSTAYGTLFQISSPLRLSSYKNGSNYDIDRGVDPDYYINEIDNYYRREKLVDYLHSLF